MKRLIAKVCLAAMAAGALSVLSTSCASTSGKLVETQALPNHPACTVETRALASGGTYDRIVCEDCGQVVQDWMFERGTILASLDQECRIPVHP